MKIIVITGSTRGIGYGLADCFLARGHTVIVSGRSQASTEQAVAALRRQHEPTRVVGQACDVQEYEQVEALWTAAREHAPQIDIWINNAGITALSRDFWALPVEEVDAVVRTNLLGILYGSRVALQGMLAQGTGQLYNMEGLGSDGRLVFAGASLYCASKSALTTFTKVIIKEVEGRQVQVGYLSPGIVVTDLVLSDKENLDRNRGMLNILADPVEAVAPYLVEQMLANRRNGARIAWLTPRKILWRFLTAPFHKRDLLAAHR